jgi:hypothetical protein
VLSYAYIGRIGFRAGLAAFTATVAYDIVQLLQLIGAVHFPVDDILIFGTSLCIVIPFVSEILALHYTTPASRQFWSHSALVFTTIYTVFGAANYVVQLATVIPAKLEGAVDSVRILEQTPHSLFWDFDAIAYSAMGFATLVIIPALGNSTRERRVRIACMANVAATVLAGVVYFHPRFSPGLLLLGIPWGITAPLFMLFLAIALRRRDSTDTV